MAAVFGCWTSASRKAVLPAFEINKIKLKKPDVIYAIVVGGSNVSFYQQMKAAGITGDKWTVLTISVTEDEVLGIGGENLLGFYSAMKYFQSLDNPNNKAFVALGLVLLWGKAGVLSMGQGVFFGLGGYCMAMFLELEASDPISTKIQSTPGIPDFMDWNQITQLPAFWIPFKSLPFSLLAVIIIPAEVAFIVGFAIPDSIDLRKSNGFRKSRGFLSPRTQRPGKNSG